MNLQEQISRIKSIMNLNEYMKIDDWGRLHDEENKILYPHKKIKNFVEWFQEEYGDYVAKQGWGIFDSDSFQPHIKYKFEPNMEYGTVFQVERLDFPEEGEALFGQLKNDFQAEELAKKLGLILDEFGVVIGWGGELFI
jgi:hypothetical protein